MNKSEQINELAAALAKAQGQFPAVQKTGKNPFFKSNYLTLDGIIAAVKSPLSKNGIAYSQLISSGEGGHTLTTMLIHTSGQWISSTSFVGTGEGAKNEMQALGSRLTYMKRYALAAILGIASDEDDDGNGGAKQKQTPHKTDEKPPATIGELLARWSELCDEANKLGIKYVELSDPTDRGMIIGRGKALAAAIKAEKAKRDSSLDAQIAAAIIEAGFSDNIHSIKKTLKYSNLTSDHDLETWVNWFSKYREAKDNTDVSTEEAANPANAWLAGEAE